MNKNTIKLNEVQLRQIVAESVKKVVNEMKYVTSIEGMQVPMFNHAGVHYHDNPFVDNDDGEHYEIEEIMEYAYNAYKMITANVHNLTDGDNKDNLLKAARQMLIAMQTLTS